jgi:hypothetical protein
MALSRIILKENKSIIFKSNGREVVKNDTRSNKLNDLNNI